MKRCTLRHVLLCGALGASFLAGCHQMARQPESIGCTNCSGTTITVRPGYTSTVPATLPPNTVNCSGPPPKVTLGTPQNFRDAVPMAKTVETREPPVECVLGIQTSTRARLGFEPSPETYGQTVVQMKTPTLPPVDIKAVATESTSLFPRGEPSPARKSFVDLTAAPCFSHAPDYNWIIGQVEYSRIAKEWRLRYASVDELDDHGGRVILIENHHVSLLHDGQYVHVHGHLVDADNSKSGPVHYRIESFKTLQDSNAPESSSGVK